MDLVECGLKLGDGENLENANVVKGLLPGETRITWEDAQNRKARRYSCHDLEKAASDSVGASAKSIETCLVEDRGNGRNDGILVLRSELKLRNHCPCRGQY